MSLFHKKTSDKRGFTLIEVIAVLIILGIIAAVAVSRVSSNQSDLIPQTDIVKSHLRFAQLKALSDDTSTSWGISFSSNSYTLDKDGGDPSINLPGESSRSHSFLPTSVTISVTPAVPVYFNSWGSLVSSLGAPLGTEYITITLTQNGNKAFKVYTNTGYIEDI
jgi:prepilin-type N-terminal cleavage/methylation domain-containing protein